ncbi:uncharacterized protein LOC143255080 isoform X1 [Tachypleus tridentatus]|uniref:uncharacterized protein LOC143255080 isoform X1 n=1 Tax=Tachypleus tridentatus TaxID=6853 RepID=UPI003FD27C85
MDVQTALIFIGVFFFIGLLLYLISVFGIKEKTYEEAIEEQRRLNLEAELQPKSDKTSKKEKKFKKWGRKSKEKGDENKSTHTEYYIQSKLETQHIEHVEFKSTAEVIYTDPEVDLRPLKPKKKNKVAQPKPILVNRDSSPPLADDEQIQRVRSNSFGKIQPKDELELKHMTHSQDSSMEPEKIKNKIGETEETTVDNGYAKEDSPLQKQEEAKKKKVREEPMKVVKDDTGHPRGLELQSKKSKKQKIDYVLPAGDNVELAASRLLVLLKNAELSAEDSQMLIDVLLTKQNEDAVVWTKKNDPVVNLKKQLQEREQQLESEQCQAQAISAKMRELKQELNKEKTRSSGLERTLREKLGQHQEEIKSLQSSIQISQDQHKKEVSSFQANIQQLQRKITEEQAPTIQRLQEENNTLKQNLSRLEKESCSRVELSQLSHELDQAKSAKELYEAKQNTLLKTNEELQQEKEKLQECVQKLKEEECKNTQQVSKLTQEIENLRTSFHNIENDNSSLKQQLEEARQQGVDKERNMKELYDSIEEARKKNDEAESQLHILQAQISDLTNKNNEQRNEINNLIQQNETLSSEISCLQEQSAAKQQESMQQNGELYNKMNEGQQMNQIDLIEHQKMLEEKDQALQQLEDELSTHKEQLLSLREEIENQKQKNNELREKNWKTMEALQISEQAAEEKLKQLQTESTEMNDRLRQEGEEKVKQAEQRLQERLQQVEKEQEEKYHQLAEVTRIKEHDIEAKVQSACTEVEGRLQQALQDVDRWKTEADKIESEKLKEICKSKEEANQRLREQENKVQELLQRIFPSIKIDNQLDFSEWLSYFEKEALEWLCKLKETSEDHAECNVMKEKLDEVSSRLQKLEMEKQKIEVQAQHYKTALAETESILNKLQNSVEGEEKVWREKLNAKDQELQKALKEKRKVNRRKTDS